MNTPDMLTNQEARQVFSYLIRRAVTDMAFRQGLLHAPRETLEQELSIELPDRFNIRFIENQGADMTIVLPDPKDPGGLSDRHLDLIAGGAAPHFFEGLKRYTLAPPVRPDT